MCLFVKLKKQLTPNILYSVQHQRPWPQLSQSIARKSKSNILLLEKTQTHTNTPLSKNSTNEPLCTSGLSEGFPQAWQHTFYASKHARRHTAAQWVAADPTRIFAYTSPQDPNAASTLGRIVPALFIHRLHSQSTRLFIIFILVEPFVPENKELIWLIRKWKTVICLRSSTEKTKTRQVGEDWEIWSEGSHYKAVFGLVLLQLVHL